MECETQESEVGYKKHLNLLLRWKKTFQTNRLQKTIEYKTNK